ncbi:MAG: hypothetical protein M0036_24295 [Desulfobacteraceae bacterium]|nr:hypothetical protein [Desulfobacteraceae bacterium]
MNDYQQQQWDALQQAREGIAVLEVCEKDALLAELREYLDWRTSLDHFLSEHFSAHCTQSCYENRRSACCSKDGIITFWADVVINVLCSNKDHVVDLEKALTQPTYSYKCTYLGPMGCCWQIRPLGCATFLCDEVQQKILSGNSKLQSQWTVLNNRAKSFRWPDQPVLFDRLEIYFLERNIRSPLMYINTSPGLMRIKQRAGLPVFAPARSLLSRTP